MTNTAFPALLPVDPCRCSEATGRHDRACTACRRGEPLCVGPAFEREQGHGCCFHAVASLEVGGVPVCSLCAPAELACQVDRQRADDGDDDFVLACAERVQAALLGRRAA